jgi:hypothetical protein
VKVVADKHWTKVLREPRKDPDAESQEEEESDQESIKEEKTKSDESDPEEPPDESDESEGPDSEAVIDDLEEEMDLELETESIQAETKNEVEWLKKGHTKSSSSNGGSETEELAPPTHPKSGEDTTMDEDDNVSEKMETEEVAPPADPT